MSRIYRDFDVEIAPEGDRYKITARFGDATAEHTFAVPFDTTELNNFFAMFEGKQSRRRLETPQEAQARAFGDRLYRTVFPEELDALLVEATRAAEAQGQGVRIRLGLDRSPLLVNLPWEYLYRSSADEFPVLSNWTPLVRYLPVEQTLPPARVEPPLKILVMISNPVEYQDTLDTEAEWDRLNIALAEPMAAGLVELTRLGSATEAELQRELRRHDIHVFHFIGHGEFSDTNQDGVVLLEDDRRRTRLVTGRALGTILQDCRSLRLAVLNNCEGARTSDLDPFAGMAQSLLRKGIPAVVAMQFEVTDEAAIAFSTGFYGGLGDGFPVDAALAEARKWMSRASSSFEFGSPVLYLATPDGAIFDVAGAAAPTTVGEATTTAGEAVIAGGPVLDARPATVEPDRAVVTSPAGDERSEAPDAPGGERGPGHESRTVAPEWLPPGRGGRDGAPRRRRNLLPVVLVGIALAAVAFFVIRPDDGGGTDGTSSPGQVTTVPGEDIPHSLTGDITVTRFESPPTIDADPTDWPENPVYTTPFPGGDGPEADPRVMSDWRLGWDEDALFVLVSVEDPEITVKHADDPATMYRGDGVDILFGGDVTGIAESQPLRDGDVQIVLGPSTTDADEAVAGKQRASDETSSTADSCPGNRVFAHGSAATEVESAARPNDDGYYIEARIPWTVLGREPDPESLYGAVLTVNDVNDNAAGTRRGNRSSVPDRRVAKHCPAQWQTLALER